MTGADTAASLGLEEGDTIEVFQVGLAINFRGILVYIGLYWFILDWKRETPLRFSRSV